MKARINPATGVTTIELEPEEAALLVAFLGWASDVKDGQRIAPSQYIALVDDLGTALDAAEAALA